MYSITLILILAFTFGLSVRHIGLPPLIGYLVAGFGLAAYGVEGGPALEHVAHAGVLLLLFSVGLKLRLKSLFRLEVLGGAIIHMIVTAFLTGLLIYYTAGLSIQSCMLIAMALSFSSTVVAAKVLEGKKELRAFHGRVAIGILITQDIIAVAFLSITSGDTPSPWAISLLALPLIRPVTHKLLDLSGHDELLILYGLLLALVIGGATFQYFGLSSELGALLLGIILAGHTRASELSDALWGLKEIFLVGFFLQIGMSGHPTLETLGYAAALCLLLPIKALLFFVILLRFKLRARSSFLTGLSLATYSEFGLIIANLGVGNGWLDTQWLTVLAISVALSFVLAAPLNRYAHVLYGRMEKGLKRFETTKRHPDDEPIHLGNSHILIMGMGRVGTGAYDFLSKRKMRVIGLDSDPGKVEEHLKKGRRVLYADAEDPGLWQNLHLDGIEAVLLAMPDLEANTIASRQIRATGYTGHVSATAVFNEQLEPIRSAGANVVYNYYDEAGVGFAEHVWEHLYPTGNEDTAEAEETI